MAEGAQTADRSEAIERYTAVRSITEELCQPLEIEDYVVQPMTDVSPPRWHLAHTTWFFETFVLARFLSDYQPVHPHYSFLFNSYYNLVGRRTERPARGTLTRPTVKEVYGYRREVDTRVNRLLETCDAPLLDEILPVLTVGLAHEQQHQELLLADIKFILFQEPLYPGYLPAAEFTAPEEGMPDDDKTEFKGGTFWFGHEGDPGELPPEGKFAYDNEQPRHERKLQTYRLANDLVCNADYLNFIQDGGYERPELWLSDGWELVREQGWKAPLYWMERDGIWVSHTLYGLREIVSDEPVTHVSYYEADAYARWTGLRLPTEFEWEHAARMTEAIRRPGTLLHNKRYHPTCGGQPTTGMHRMFGEVWEWTQSPYQAYPNYRAPRGAIGEYNGKFMVNQMVLRGGSIATPRDHLRPTYRNFWHPDKRWQFTGIRLAEDI